MLDGGQNRVYRDWSQRGNAIVHEVAQLTHADTECFMKIMQLI